MATLKTLSLAKDISKITFGVECIRKVHATGSRTVKCGDGFQQVNFDNGWTSVPGIHSGTGYSPVRFDEEGAHNATHVKVDDKNFRPSQWIPIDEKLKELLLALDPTEWVKHSDWQCAEIWYKRSETFGFDDLPLGHIPISCKQS